MNTEERDNRLLNIFFPQYLSRTEEIMNERKKLVHYTSASTSLSILQHKEIWMRNTRCMNDFSEVRYGIRLFSLFCQRPQYQKLKEAFGIHGKDFEEAMAKAINNFDEWTNTTYITCFSEHDDSEDQIGRLSMWRGYGSDSSVAIVLKPDSFISANKYFGIYTSPVEYLRKDQFDELINQLVDRVQSEKDFLESLDASTIQRWVFSMVKFAVVSIKHPGFKEEREWRVIADPESFENLHQAIISVNGVPQIVMKIPLTYKKQNEDDGFSIDANLDHLIIGPTPYPAVIGKALATELKQCGVDHPEKRICASDIPYRSHL